MPDFAVLRFAKITSLKGLSGVSAHNSRTAVAGLNHARNHTPHMGGGIQHLAGCEDAVEAWHTRTRAVGLSKPRKDAVRAIEVVMSASADWFARSTPEERSAWRDQSMAWAAQTFGAENILSAYCHDDENLPHIHFLAVPLTRKERKKAGRPRKGREGCSRAASAAWGLSASDFIGSPEKLTMLQTSYAAKLVDLGLRRGRPRRTTGAQHRSATAYRAETAEQLELANRAHSEALNELSNAKGVQMFALIDAEQITEAAKQSAVETAAAFSVGLDAIDAGELVYCPAKGKKPAGLKRHRVEASCLPSDQTGLKKWSDAVRPFLSKLIGYARRLNSIATRENDLTVEATAIQSVADRQALEEKTLGPARRNAEIISKALSARKASGKGRECR